MYRLRKRVCCIYLHGRLSLVAIRPAWIAPSRMRFFDPRFIVLYGCLALGAGALAQLAPATIDHSKASVRGMKAFGVWPQTSDDPQPRDPRGFEVILASHEDPKTWIRFPAGTWHLPAAGLYSFLLEGSQQVSPYPSNLSWVIEPYRNRGLAATKRLVPAARIQTSGKCPSGSCTAWMLHETSNIQTPVPYFAPEMMRQLPLTEAATQGVLMPAGRLAVAIYDSVGTNFVALGVPVTVAPLKTVRIEPVAPAAGHSSLILELVRPAPLDQRPDDDVVVSLITEGGRKIDPVFVTRTHRKILALWADVSSGAARVDLKSSKCRLTEDALRLRSGKVESISLPLAAMPKLKVALEIPERVRSAAGVVTVVDLSGQTSPVKRPVHEFVNEIELEAPAAPLRVSLTAGPWSVEKLIDLTDGHDASVLLKMELIQITGHVYLGDDPAHATLRFNTRDDWEAKGLSVKTDDEGEYEALFVTPRVYTLLIDLPKRQAPFIIPGIRIDQDRTCDFHVPANAYQFHVVDRDRGKPVAGAAVMVENTGEDGMQTFQRIWSDDQGIATAQPLRPGQLRATANAEGFFASAPYEETVRERGDRTVTLDLEPTSDSRTLSLFLPTGAQAAGAEILVDQNGIRSWTLRADDLGRVKIPSSAKQALVLVRVPGTALLARRWGGIDERWTLEPAAPPLVLRAVHHDESSASNAPAILWVDGVRLAGGDLAWVTATQGGADTAGFWTVTNLPSRPVDILLWKSTPQNYGIVPTGAFDSMRTNIPFPWPSQLELQVLQ